MAKQTFTTGQVLTATQVNSLQSNDFNQTVSVKTAAYTLVAADKGTRIEFNTSGSVAVTVNTGLFDAGDTLVIQNRGAGVVTVTAGTATVNTSATLALSQYDAGTLYFVSASAAIFFNTDAGGTSPLTTKGDLYGFSTVDARIPIGANNTVLTADSAEALGLKWATPAGGMTLISTTTLSGATTTISTTSGYNQLLLWVNNHYPTADASVTFRLNADSGSNYSYIRDTFTAPSTLASSAEIISNFGLSDNYKNTNTTNTLIFTINNPNSTTDFKPCNLWQRYLNSSNVQTSVNHRGTYLSTSAITSIVLGATGTTWAGGTALLYGVK